MPEEPSTYDCGYTPPPPLGSVELKRVPVEKFDALVAAAKSAEICLTNQSDVARRQGRDGLYWALKEVCDRLAAALEGIE